MQDVLASCAGDRLAQHRMDPAHRLGAQPGEVVVAAHPDPDHHGPYALGFILAPATNR